MLVSGIPRTRDEIRFVLNQKGTNFSKIARSLNPPVAPQIVHRVASGKNIKRVRQAIIEAMGIDVSINDVWPDHVS